MKNMLYLQGVFILTPMDNMKHMNIHIDPMDNMKKPRSYHVFFILTHLEDYSRKTRQQE